MMIVWLKRATGIGYYSYPPLAEIIDQKKAEDMEQKTRNLCEEVDYIERELTRRHN